MKYYITLSLVTVCALAACHTPREQKAAAGRPALSDSMQQLLRLDTVTYRSISNELSLSGKVSFNENNMVKVFPRSGGQVIETMVSLGDKVSKGQVLAVIRSADIAGSYSDLGSARADVAIAKRQMENAEALYRNGIGSERAYMEAKESYSKALAAMEKVQSLISINGGDHTTTGGNYLITAPVSGYVVEKKIAVGAYIRPDMGDNLFTVSDLKNVWIYANVYETDIAKIKEGYEAKVIAPAYPDKVFYGHIDRVSPVLDPQSKAMRIRVTLGNKDMLLKPDMFAKVIVRSEEGQKAICIPTAALVSQNGKDYVVVYRSSKDLSVAEVKVMKTIGDHTFLAGGVQPGTRLVTRYQNLLFAQLMNE